MLDVHYINLISGTLDRFKWNGNKANFRCPVCGDSNKSSTKARGWFFPGDNDDYMFHCFNCNAVIGSLSNYLKLYHPNDYKQYIMDKFSGNKKRSNFSNIKKTNKIIVKSNNIKLPSVTGIYKDYLIERCIPESKHHLFSFTDNFKKFAIDFLDGSNSETNIVKLPTDKRLLIPFYDENNNINVIQGRSIDKKSNLRYITLKRDPNASKVYGMERVKYNDKAPVCVVEGPIDSVLIPNCIASADSNLLTAKGDIYIYDNQYRNAEIVNAIQNTIDKGHKVTLFPEYIDGKDLNKMVENGMSVSELYKMILENTYSGLMATCKFSDLRKV